MSDLKNSPYKTAVGVTAHPGSPRGGSGTGGSSAVGSPLADRQLAASLIYPEAPVAANWSPQQIADPGLYQRAKCIYQVLKLADELWPAAVLEETGYQLKGVLQSFIPGLLEMLAVIGLSTVGGAALGGAIGFLFGGVGAAPGAVVGAQLGAEVSTAILTWMGLGFLIKAIGEGLGELAFIVSDACSIAWHAAEYPQDKKQRINQAARQLARAVAVLVRLILQGILAYVLKNAAMSTAKASLSTAGSLPSVGVKATVDASLAEVTAILRKSKLPDEFALWLEKNWNDVARNPKLMRKSIPTAAKNESVPTTTPSQLKAEMERQKSVANREESPSAESVEPKKKTTAEKGVFGEAKADEYMENSGFKKLNGNLVKEGDTPKGRGIDGVWENTKPPPDYVITEAKYGSANLNTLKDGTKQMSPEWIDARLDREVGPTTAAKIRDADLDGSVERWVLKVDEPGNVTKKMLLDGEP